MILGQFSLDAFYGSVTLCKVSTPLVKFLQETILINFVTSFLQLLTAAYLYYLPLYYFLLILLRQTHKPRRKRVS